MIKSRHLVALGALLTVTMAAAQEGQYQTEPYKPLYRDREFQVDLFGTYLNPEGIFPDLFETSIHHGVWGGGAGINYFFMRNVGIGTDFNASHNPGDNWDFDYWTGDVYLRLPIGKTPISPYVYGTGGRSIGSDSGYPSWQWLYGGGVGLELRFLRNVGVFGDTRFLWSDESSDFNALVFRFGLRLAF